MNDSLSFESLLAGACKFAGLAMSARASSDAEQFALHAGVAVERLAKAALVQKAPDLILDMKSAAGKLYHLAGLKVASKVRTISLTEAIDRLRQLEVLTRQDERLDLLVALRNGVAHSTGEETAEDLLPTFARTIEALLDHVDEDHKKFWGTWHPTVVAILDDCSSTVREVAMRIQNHKHLFEARTSGMPKEMLEEYLKSISEEPREVGYYSGSDWVGLLKPVACPACPGVAGAWMTVPVQSLTADPVPVVMDELLCRHCQLPLVGCGEMEAAGLQSTIDVDILGDSEYVKDLNSLKLLLKVFGSHRPAAST